MITWMQKHKKYLVVTIWISTIAFVGAGFVGWGAYDMNTDRSNAIAKVGDRKISVQEFQNKYAELHGYYSQLAEGRLSEERAKELGIENLAISALINESLMLNFADDLGLSVSDEDVVKYIVADQNFHVDGKFDKKTYAETLKRVGLKEADYESGLRKVILLDKLRHAINIPASKQDIDLMTAGFLMQDRVSLQVVGITPEELVIDEAAVKKLWEDSKNNYKTQTDFKVATKFIAPISTEANATELNEFYNENKELYKGSDEKIKPFESVKDEVLKDYNLKQTKKVALEEYLFIKKGEKQATDEKSITENDTDMPIDEIKELKAGDTLKPFEHEDGYLIVKLKEIIAPRVMTYEEAKEQILEVYKEQKTQELVENKAKQLLENGFNGKDIGFISRDSQSGESGLSDTEFNLFVSKLFESGKKKGYIMLSDKAAVYEILEQKLLDSTKENEYKDVIIQNVSYLKNSELAQDLTNALQKRYKVEQYYK